MAKILNQIKSNDSTLAFLAYGNRELLEKSSEVKEFVQQCKVCRLYNCKRPLESLHSHDPLDRPWSTVGVDLLTINGRE